MKREEWIDISRSIVMIMVIFGHIGSFLVGKGFDSHPMSIYFMTTSAIKIPGFFAISGYLFHDKEGKTGPFIKNKILKILVPYLTLGMVNMVLNIVDYGIDLGGWNPTLQTYSVNYFKNFLLGKNLWFIPCLFVVEILFYIIKRICKSDLFMMGMVSSAVCMAGYLWSDPKVTIPWRIDTACICVFYLYIGYMIRHWEKLREFILSYKGFVSLAAIYFILAARSYQYYGWKNLDVNQNMYYNFELCFLMIIVGIALLFSFAKVLKSCPPLSYVGQNTLAYFIFHMFFVKFVYIIISRGNLVNTSTNIIVYVVILCIAVMLCMVPLIMLINKLIPFTVGKKYGGKHEK